MSKRNNRGGTGSDNDNGYVNPALDTSTESVIDTERRGSESFIVITEENRQLKKPSIDKLVHCIKTGARKVFTKKTLYKRLPIIDWLPKYNLEWAVGDMIAGITVALTVIPQALAYASITGFGPEYGLYGSFLGCFVYIIFGSCKDVTIGPTAIAALMTFQAMGGYDVQYAILLCFLSGVVEVILGVVGLGFIVDFVSGPVSTGFTSAGALVIITSQIRDILGYAVTGNTFLEMWISIFGNIHNISLWDSILGCACIVFLLLMKQLAAVQFGPKPSKFISNDKSPFDEVKPKTWHKVVNKSLWFASTARNAFLVVIGGVMAYAIYEEGQPLPFRLIGDVPKGLPDPKVPPFGYENGNVTHTFGEMLSNLGGSIVVVPLIAILENMALCKAFADGKPIDTTQELIALGLTNIANSFMQGYPGNAPLARGAINHCSGVATPFGGFHTGVVVILTLLFFTPYFFYIPKPALAAVTIAASFLMVDIRIIKPMWRSKKSDLVSGIATFIACLLLPLEFGILVGIGLNMIFILKHAARPEILIEKLTTETGIEYLMLTPDRWLIFPSLDYVRRLVTKHSLKEDNPVVIDCSYIYGADFTAAQVMQSIAGDFAARNQVLVFYNLKSCVSSVFEGLSAKEFVVVYTQEQLDNLLAAKCDSKDLGIGS